MKYKACAFPGMILALCFLADSAHAGDLLKHMSLRLSAGWRSQKLNDIQRLDQNLDPLLIQIPLDSGLAKEGDVKDLSMGIDYVAEFMVTPVRNFAIAVAGGAMRCGQQSQIFLTNEDLAIDVLNQPRFTVSSLAVSLYYHLPDMAVSKMDTYFFAGAEFNFAKIDWTLHSTYFGRETRLVADGRGLGFRGGLGYEFKVFSPICLFAELGGRVCDLKNWHGEISRRMNGATVSSEGPLWTYEEKDKDLGKWYSKVDVSAEEPGADSIRKVGSFVGCLTGFFVRLGIRVNL